MHLLQGVIFSLLAATSVAIPSRDASREITARQANGAGYSLKQPPLTTPWTDKVGTDPWPEYPRPQLQRPQWQNLNGVWGYQNASSLDAVQSPPFGKPLGQEVLVPSCLESGLSGKCFLFSIIHGFLNNRSPRRYSRGVHVVFVVLQFIQGPFGLEESEGAYKLRCR